MATDLRCMAAVAETPICLAVFFGDNPEPR